MKTIASQLQIGTVMITGEILHKCAISETREGKKLMVTLFNPKSGKFRIAFWNLKTMISHR